MAKAKPEAAPEAAAAEPSHCEKAQAALANALARTPGIEGDLGDVIAYLSDEVTQ